MEEELANLNLLDDEEAFQGDITVVERNYQFCLVGRCLTDSVVHFSSLRNTMADLWHPIGGICITDLGDKRYLFQFFNDVDVQRVATGTPWFFNNHLLILQRIQNGENPSDLVLNFTEFWVQTHELPSSLMNETMANQFGDCLGKFLDFDNSNPVSGNQKYMRIRVRLDVTGPLKRKKKIQIGKGMVVYARFKYEKLSLFCFICGRLRHGESYCPFRLKIEPSKIIFGWDLSLRAVPRRRNTVVSRWLREVDGSQCCGENMESFSQGSNFNKMRDSGRQSGENIGNQLSNPNLIPLGSNHQYCLNGQSNWRN
ncbi:uncharacterized protein [Gossypium hirsutum]|uniref:Uncharacterized protein n=1 Tax=Gossypium hirsutum TaxID=3635 RepID=A0ABM3BWH1_GOSHI|nr:uncharacterized protein LOC121230556 [Gossypium hirsutum]